MSGPDLPVQTSITSLPPTATPAAAPPPPPPASRGPAGCPPAARGRRVSPRIDAASSSRSCAETPGSAIASAAAEIAVSGLRRSCETARSSAVFTTSAWRSAAVSTTPPCSRSRSSAALSSASSAGTTRSCNRYRLRSELSAPTTTVPSRRSPSRSGNATLRASGSTASITIAADCSSSACAIRAAAVGSTSARLPPRSSTRAISVTRLASRRRSSASRRDARIGSGMMPSRRDIAVQRRATQVPASDERATRVPVSHERD